MELRNISLAVKHRPRNFASLTGQKHVSAVLRKAVETGQVPQQLLFSGSSGLGKTTVARICAAAILCETPLDERDRGDACLQCDSCLDITEPGRNHNDVIEFDAASNGSKDEIKEIALRASYKPLRGDWKIYIIDEAHGLSGPGGQAFLKLLEEPPSHVIFMLATTDPQKMLSTNRSRCVNFELVRPSNKEIVENLKRVGALEGWEVEDQVAQTIVDITDPALGVRGTIMSLEKLSGFLSIHESITPETLGIILGVPDSEKISSLVKAIETSDKDNLFASLETLRAKSSDLSIRNALIKVYRKQMFESENDESFALNRWRYRLLVEAPNGESWTDVTLAKALDPSLDPSPQALKAQLQKAEKLIAELSLLLDASATSKEVPSRAQSKPEKTPVNSSGENTVTKDVTATRSEPHASENSKNNPSTAQNQAPPPVAQTPVQNEPRKPVASQPSNSTVKEVNPSRTNNQEVKKTDTLTKMFLGAGPSSEEIVEFVNACQFKVQNKQLLILVPRSHQRKANLLAKDLYARANKLGFKLGFASLG